MPSWLYKPPVAKVASTAAKQAVEKATPASARVAGQYVHVEVRTVLRKPLRDPLRDQMRAAARGVFAHRGPWAVEAQRSRCVAGATLGGAARGAARSIVGASAVPTQGRFMLASQWLARQAMIDMGSPSRSLQVLRMQRFIYEEARAAAWRAHVRCVSSLCGLSVGMGVACLAVSLFDRWQSPDAVLRSPLTTDRPSFNQLDTLARNLVRKNSKRTIDETYTFAAGPPLGVGSFGVVHRATHVGSGLERAVKCIDKEETGDVAMLSREVEALRNMDHPNVCRLIEYYETDKHLWLVLELCKGEELCELLLRRPSGLPENEVSHLMAQMLKATLHCHWRAVLHRDLKPENFLFKDVASDAGNALKLVDFGFCIPVPPSTSPLLASLAGLTARLGNVANPLPCFHEKKRDGTSAGTLLYRSPESLRGELPSRSDDAWSLGVIFYILLTGQFPFSTNDDDAFQELFSRGLLQEDVQEHLDSLLATSDAADLARRLLAFDPAKRISVECALQHPFITAAVGEVAGAAAERRLEAGDVYDRCNRFLRYPRLRRIAAAAAARLACDDISHSAASSSAAFTALDKRGVGRITASDLQEFFVASGGFVPSSSWFASLTRGWPALAEPQGISYTAFAATMQDDVLTSGGGRLSRAVFDILDAGRDGVVCAEDLSRRLGLPAREADMVISEALDLLGADFGEKMTSVKPTLAFPEFLRLMRMQRSSLASRATARDIVASNSPAAVSTTGCGTILPAAVPNAAHA